VGWPIRVESRTPGVWRTPAGRQIHVAWPILAGQQTGAGPQIPVAQPIRAVRPTHGARLIDAARLTPAAPAEARLQVAAAPLAMSQAGPVRTERAAGARQVWGEAVAAGAAGAGDANPAQSGCMVAMDNSTP
jgi:hypothetical protein